MHPPRKYTPMMRIGFKKSAILSLAAITTVSALLTGCKRPVEKADEAVAADVKQAQESIAGIAVFGQSTMPLSATGTTLTVDAATADTLTRQLGPSGVFILTGAPAIGGSPVSTTVTYSSVKATTANPVTWQITITPTGTPFAVGSVVRPPDGYALKVLNQTMAKNTLASPAQKAIANFAAGQAEVLAADVTFNEIDEAQNHLERLLGRVAAMATSLHGNHLIIGGLTAKEPTKSLAEIDKTAAAAKTGEQGVWFASDTAPIPALAAIDKAIADLTAAADAMKAKHADMEKQRADALVQAEKLSSQSEQAKGKQSVDLFVQAANLRKDASTISTQLQDLDSQMAGNARELAVVAAQQVQLQTALTKFADENKQVSAGWVSVKKRIDDVVVLSKAIVAGDAADATTPAASPTTLPSTNPSEPPLKSLTDAGDRIVQVSADIDKLRKDAKDHLAKADGYFAEAAKLNKEVSGVYSAFLSNPNLRESPQRPAWVQMLEIYNDVDPTLKRAEVAQRLARLYADDVYYSGTRVAIDKAVQAVVSPAEAPVKAVLDQAGLALPKTFDPGTLSADIDTSKAAANDAFKQSETYLDQIIGKPTSNDTGAALLTAANVTKMIEQYGHWAFARGISDNQADGFLSTSKGLAATLTLAENVSLPLPLPPEIAPTPPASLTSGAPATSTSPASLPGVTPDTNPVATDTTPEQKAVRAAYVEFLTAVVAGDAAKAKTSIIPDPGSEAMIDILTGAIKSAQKLQASILAKFPDQTTLTAALAQGQAMAQAQLTQAAQKAITVNGDTATIGGGPSGSSPDVMKKVDGAWKLAPDANPQQALASVEPLKKIGASYDAISADLDSGKITTLPDLSARLLAAAKDAGIPIPGQPAATAPATSPTDATPPATTPAAPGDATTPPATTPAAPGDATTPPATPPK